MTSTGHSFFDKAAKSEDRAGEARTSAHAAIFETLDSCIWSVDPRGQLLTFNSSYAFIHKEFTGRNPAPGDSCLDLLNRSGLEGWKELFEKGLSGQRVTQETDKYVNGGLRSFKLSVDPVLKGRQVVALTCYYLDVTQKREYDRGIIRAKANLDAIINNTGDAIFSVDRQYRLLTANEAFKTASFMMTGVQREEGDSFFLANWPEEVNRMWKRNLDRALNGERFRISTALTINRNVIETEISFNPIIENGVVSGVGCFARDVTDERGRELRLRQSEMRFRSLTEHSSDLKAMIDEQGQIMYISPAISRTLGYTDAELRHINLADVLVAEDRESFLRKMETGLQNPGVPFTAETRCLAKSGEIVWLQGTITNMLHVEGVSAVIANYKDVTAEKESQLLLLESERKYRSLFENNPLSMWVLDHRLACVDVNRSALDTFGYTKDEFLRLAPGDLCTEGSRSQLMSYLGSPSHDLGERLIVEMLTRGGDTLIAELSLDLFAVNGKQSVVLIANNVTERVRTEEKLRITNERYELVTRATNDALWDWNIEQNEVFWSEGFSKLFGHRHGSGLFINWAQHVHPEDAPRVFAKLSEAMSNPGSGSWDDEYRYIKSDGSISHVYDRGFISYDESGRPRRMVGAMQDITKRKTAEDLLRQSEANLRTIFDNTHIAFILLDNDLRVRSFNHPAAVLCARELLAPIAEGQNYVALIPRERRKVARRRLQSALSGEKISYETNFLYHEEPVWYKVSAFPVNDSNAGTFGIILTIEDITLKKAVELERERITLDLMERNATLEQFAYIISHNLRSPVANITGLSRLILGGRLSETDNEKCLNGLATSVKMLDEVIIDLNHILQVRREINEKKEQVDLSKLCRDVCASINNLMIRENVVMHTDFSECSTFFALKSYLHSIFYNLISNSIKYKHPDRAPHIEIKARKVHKKLVLVFKDNGLGIDLGKYGSKMFGLYKKFHMHADGKGMGLFMVKTQVEILGGTINVSSRVNKGTKFVVQFDLEPVKNS